jgi:serine/threonine protein kinase
MKIPGYLTLEKLSQGMNFAVYRAIKEKDSSPSILKTLDKKTARNLNDINALRHEYHLLKAIDSDYVIKAVDWIEEKDYAVIVMEDINGQSLKDHFKESRFPVSKFCGLAVPPILSGIPKQAA